MSVSIAEAFPSLAKRGVLDRALSEFDLTGFDLAIDLVESSRSRQLFARLARALIDDASDLTLGSSLPGLEASAKQVIIHGTFSERPTNALRRAKGGQSRTWASLTALTPAGLLAITNLGITSAIEIVTTAAQQSVAALTAAGDQEIGEDEGTKFATQTDHQVPQHGNLRRDVARHVVEAVDALGGPGPWTTGALGSVATSQYPERSVSGYYCSPGAIANALQDGRVPGLVVDSTTKSGAPNACKRARTRVTASRDERWPARGAFRIVAQWLQDAGVANELGPGFRVLYERQEHLPPDVAAAWEAVQAVSLNLIAEPLGRDGIESLLNALDTALENERTSSIFWARISLAPPTLEELGERWNLTRERVRQLQIKAEDAVNSLIKRPDFAGLRWRCEELRSRIGSAFPADALWARDAFRDALRDVPTARTEHVRSLFLWIAGPYALDASGWVRIGALPQRDVIADAVDEDGRLDLGALTEKLASAGLVVDAVGPWLKQHARMKEIDGVVYSWDGTVADKAFILLSAWNRPATAEEVSEAIGEGRGVRSTRARLLQDARFKRVDRMRFGLRNWNLDEYTGIVDEITEEIARRGGEADVREVIATVATNYDARAGSVEAYTGAPRFVVEGGRIRLRSAEEPYQPRRDLTDETRCYLLSDATCAYRLTVDGEVLRGSGRPIPEGLGAWLGVMPGKRRLISIDHDEIPVTWPDSALLGPSIGSLRRTAAAFGAVAGDFLLLTFDRDSSSGHARVINQDALAKASPKDQIAMLTGVQTNDGDLERALATAVGATTASGLRDRVRRRAEDELLVLLPNRVSELDGAFDRLKRVL